MGLRCFFGFHYYKRMRNVREEDPIFYSNRLVYDSSCERCGIHRSFKFETKSYINTYLIYQRELAIKNAVTEALEEYKREAAREAALVACDPK